VNVTSTIDSVGSDGAHLIKGGWNRVHIPTSNATNIASAVVLHKTDQGTLNSTLIADGTATNQLDQGTFVDQNISFNTIDTAAPANRVNTFRAVYLDPNGTSYNDLGLAGGAVIVPFIVEASQSLVPVKRPTAGVVTLSPPVKGQEYIEYYFTTAPQAHGTSIHTISTRFHSLIPNSLAPAGQKLSEFTAVTATMSSIADVDSAIQAFNANSANKLKAKVGEQGVVVNDGFMFGVNYQAEIIVGYSLPQFPAGYSGAISNWGTATQDSVAHAVSGGLASVKMFKDPEILSVKAVNQQVQVTFASNGGGFPDNGNGESGANRMVAYAWKGATGGGVHAPQLQVSAQANTGFADATSSGSSRGASSYTEMNQNQINLNLPSPLMNFGGDFDLLVSYFGNLTDASLIGGPAQVVLCRFDDANLQAHLDAVADINIFNALSTLLTQQTTASNNLFGNGGTQANPAAGSVEAIYVAAVNDVGVKVTEKNTADAALASATNNNAGNIALETGYQADKDAASDAVAANTTAINNATQAVTDANTALTTAITNAFGNAGTFSSPAAGSAKKALDDAATTLAIKASAWHGVGQPTSGTEYDELVVADTTHENAGDTYAPLGLAYDNALIVKNAAEAAKAAHVDATAALLTAETNALLALYQQTQNALAAGGSQIAYNNAYNAAQVAQTNLDAANTTLATAERNKYNKFTNNQWETGTALQPNAQSLYQIFVDAQTAVVGAAKPSGYNDNKPIGWYNNRVNNAENTSDIMTISYKSQDETTVPVANSDVGN
jgi:hypothetical protein